MSDPYLGQVIADRFEITSRLGEGGMGVVYFAEDRATKGRAAVKFLHRHLVENEEFVARFRQEARTASRFRHENAVRILDSGDDAEGIPFIAMDFCPGRSLRALINERAPLDFPRACRIAEQVLRALATAHESGIIHRDLKPDNIKVEEGGETGDRVKVLDFGVAKFIGTEDLEEMTGAVKTATGIVFGTPKYMAPEQIKGEKVDARSDLYAVGAILYEMLTGTPTFDAEDMMEFVTRFLHEPVQPLRRRAPHLDLPTGLERLVMGLLDKERGERPEKASVVADDLEEFVKRQVRRDREEARKGLRPTHFLFLVGGLVGMAGAIAATLLPDNMSHLEILSLRGFCRTYPVVPASGLVAGSLAIGSLVAFLAFPRVGEMAFLCRTFVVSVFLLAAGGAMWFLSRNHLPDTQQAYLAKWVFSFPLAGGLIFVLFSLGWGLRRRFWAFFLGGIVASMVTAVLLPIPTASGLAGIWEIRPLELARIRPAVAVAAVSIAFGLCGMLAPRALVKARR